MAIRRVSDWEIVWAPGTAGERTLLAAGDLMAEELSNNEASAVAVGVLDGTPTARLVSRGNAARRMEFSRVIEHETMADAWKANMQAMAAEPWGITSSLPITPAGQSVREVRAALLSTSHTMATDNGAIETIHRYRFRVSRNTL